MEPTSKWTRSDHQQLCIESSYSKNQGNTLPKKWPTFLKRDPRAVNILASTPELEQQAKGINHPAPETPSPGKDAADCIFCQRNDVSRSPPASPTRRHPRTALATIRTRAVRLKKMTMRTWIVSARGSGGSRELAPLCKARATSSQAVFLFLDKTAAETTIDRANGTAHMPNYYFLPGQVGLCPVWLHTIVEIVGFSRVGLDRTTSLPHTFGAGPTSTDNNWLLRALLSSSLIFNRPKHTNAAGALPKQPSPRISSVRHVTTGMTGSWHELDATDDTALAELVEVLLRLVPQVVMKAVDAAGGEDGAKELMRSGWIGSGKRWGNKLCGRRGGV
ncbi:hypothetical protein K440DRAFT_644119 [Wilcoxina mikolae CBS 423.85]|nr:hypothetical protein K440DRAFT_644119 [Wilcoxina mikolae CBS 423.85]